MHGKGEVGRRTTIWLGIEEESDSGYGFDVHSEDDMVAVEGMMGHETIEVFIHPDLFPDIRRVMDNLEKKEGSGDIVVD
jgi:hypothetical protein